MNKMTFDDYNRPTEDYRWALKWKPACPDCGTKRQSPDVLVCAGCGWQFNPVVVQPLPGAHVKRHRVPMEWPADEVALLGTMRDIDLAKLLNCNRNRVTNKRCQLNIPNYKKPSTVTRKVWNADEIMLLGTASDSKVGKLLGRSTACVSDKRAKLKIASHRARTGRDAA